MGRERWCCPGWTLHRCRRDWGRGSPIAAAGIGGPWPGRGGGGGGGAAHEGVTAGSEPAYKIKHILRTIHSLISHRHVQ